MSYGVRGGEIKDFIELVLASKKRPDELVIVAMDARTGGWQRFDKAKQTCKFGLPCVSRSDKDVSIVPWRSDFLGIVSTCGVMGRDIESDQGTGW
jgi:hypothetical protein